MPNLSNSSSSCATFGWCGKCQTEHRLEQGAAHQLGLDLMEELQDSQSINLSGSSSPDDLRLSTDYLFGPARGQMFGVLECENEQGERSVLRAFSCQYNGMWLVPGWVPPIFDVGAYDEIMIPGDRRIKELGKEIESGLHSGDDLKILMQKRRVLSRSIMKELHGLYRLANFRGDSQPMTDFFRHTNGPPTGAGDCCAPKLLHQAIKNNLRPLGLAEFYWGQENRSASREHGRFYGACSDKCQPILGFMLCGAEL